MSQKPIPIALRDVSYSNVKRKIVDVLFFEPLTDAQLVAEAQKTIETFVGKYGEAQALSVFFWRNREDVGKRKASASVDYAPYGQWEQAHIATPGDYSLHRFAIQFNDTGEDEDMH